MPAVATDNFNRADGGLGANWTDTVDEGSTPLIDTNVVKSDGGLDAAAFYSAAAFDNDQYSQIEVTAKGGYLGVLVRASAGDWVIGQCGGSGNNLNIRWYNGAAYTVIGSDWTGTVNVGDIIKLEVIGTTFNLYQNGVLRVSGVNASAPASGKPGLSISAASGRVDNWEGGNVSAGGSIKDMIGSGIIAFAR